MKWVKRIALIIVSLVILAVGGFLIWTQLTYDATAEIELLYGETQPSGEDLLTFSPNEANGQGIILYPGAKVEPEAYGVIGSRLAEEGYTVFIPKVTLNIAFFDINKAEEIQAAHPEILTWVVGGHSLGGVAAASFAYENEVAGVFFLASYPQSSNDFSETATPMISIYGEDDGLTSPEDIESSRPLFSDEAIFYEIEGGNHAQFGVYGEQRGDNPASITVAEQQEEVVNALLNWLEEF
ncbi:alpha/beta hydrolase [Paenalkalicoccus suaedae]|uniref:Alpha/beta hydrolase n=1 Tax=Paenalkalicoccus suaedae TaxID=2592382 RepID=A0A859FBY4_9BACI|nr:alpha/beta hydrolase [Paenalkalicoccus suaedae]QKS70054.1 alpha/beta hydrolase [Paenalkalicoccus suaedae]